MYAKLLKMIVPAALVAASVGVMPTLGAHASAGPKVSVFATGLNNPRGITFGPDGNLYVAEGGVPGGTLSTVGVCEQATAPVGPYTGNFSARISKVSPSGHRSTVISGLPSSATSPDLGNLASGVADVKFLNGHLYALISGAGCSHAHKSWPNSIIRVNSNGSWTRIDDLSAYDLSHSVTNPDPSDFEPDGTWFSMVPYKGFFFTSDPNHQDVVRAATNGSVRRLLDLSKSFSPADHNWHGPTAWAQWGGDLYVGTLNEFPVVPGSSEVLKLTLDSDLDSANIHAFATGLTTVLGLAFDRQGNLYVSEMSVVAGGPAPATGKIIRIDHASHARTTVADGLTFPTAIAFGPDYDDLYVSVNSLGPGQVLKIDTDNDGD